MEFDVDLHEKMSLQKSHFFLLQTIEWLINTDTYAREIPAVQRMAISASNYPRPMHSMGANCSECVACRVDNVTF